MGRFVTRDDMVEYVRARLGHPCIDLELNMAETGGLGHIHLAIDDSLDWMYRHNQDEADFFDYIVVFTKKGILEYDVPVEVTDAIDASPAWGNGFTPWMAFDVGAGESLVATTGWSQFDLVTYVAAQRYLGDVKKLLGLSYQLHLQPEAHKLRLYPTPKEDRAIIVQVYTKAKISEVFGNILFRDLVTARTKLIWGGILGKDKVPLPGGGTITGDQIEARAAVELEKAEKRIDDQSARPFIMIG